MKKLYWNKVPNMNRPQTIWKKIKPFSLELDYKELEELFHTKKQEKTTKSGESTGSESTDTSAANVEAKKAKLSFIDAKRANNIGNSDLAALLYSVLTLSLLAS